MLKYSLMMVLLLILLAPALAQEAPEDILLREINSAREIENTERVYPNPLLMQAAQRHSEDMAGQDVLSHEGSDGSQFWERVQATGYLLTVGAENVLARDDTDASAAFQQWFDSPPHQANLLNPDYFEVGMAYAQSESGRYYFTVVFGSRADFAVPTLTPIPTQTLSATEIALSSQEPTLIPTQTLPPAQAITARPTATPTLTPTVMLPPDIRLIYDANTFTLINVSRRILNLANLVFVSDTRSLASQRWNTEFLTQRLTSFTEDDCLQIWTFDVAIDPGSPIGCDVRHAWIAISRDDAFWLESETFTVTNNNQTIGLCATSVGECDINLSRPTVEASLPTSTPTAAFVQSSQPTRTLIPAQIPTTETLATGDIQLRIEPDHVTLVNTSGVDLDLSSLVFQSEIGTFGAGSWNTNFLSRPLIAFPTGDCLQVWALGLEAGARNNAGFTEGCNIRHGWVTARTYEQFWVNTVEFQVFYQGRNIWACAVSDRICDIELP